MKQKAVYAILLAALAIHALHIAHYFFVADDGYIYFRFARNLAEGFGPVWNPGEYVEGYNSIAWLALLSLLYAFGVPLPLGAPALSIVLTGGCLWILYRFAQRLFPGQGPLLFALGALFLALNRSWNVWATGGLETRIYTFFMVWAIFELLDSLGLFAPLDPKAQGSPEVSARHTLGASVLVGMTPLMRMDAFLTGALVILAALAWYWLRYRPNFARFVRSGLLAGTPALLIVAAYSAFRYIYFGDYLPNTYYAKVGPVWPEMGLLYFQAVNLEYGLQYLLLFATVVFTLHYQSERLRLSFVAFLAATILPQLVYYLYKVGGDFFEYRLFDLHFFFLALLIPRCALLLFQAPSEPFQRWLSFARRVPRGVLQASGVLLIAWLAVLHLTLPNWRLISADTPHMEGTPLWDNSTAEVKQALGPLGYAPGTVQNMKAWVRLLYRVQRQMIARRQEHFAEYAATRVEMFRPLRDVEFPADAVTADSGIGIPGHFLRIPLIDTLGLTDPVVARNPVTTENEKRLHAHNRRPPPGYLKERGVNIYPLCLIDERIARKQQILDHCVYRGVPPFQELENFYLVQYEDRYLVLRSPDEAWLRANYSLVEALP